MDQQLAAEPSPGAINVTIPESGNVLAFTRSIQVNGEAPLNLRLKLSETRGANGWFVVALLAAAAAAAGLAFPRRSES